MEKDKLHNKLDLLFHIRKSLSELTSHKHISKIVDNNIKRIILNHLKENGIAIDSDFKIPKGLFFKKDEKTGSLIPRIFIPNKRGEPVPVLKVRLREEIGNAVKLKDDINQWVNPRNNHHVLIYKDQQGELKESIVKFWEVVERKIQKAPLYQLPHDGNEIVTTLSENDMFLLNLKDEEIDWENLNFNLISKHLF